MITKEVIDNIYKQYSANQTRQEELDLGLLFRYAIENHTIFVDDDTLIIDSIEEGSPFRSIPLKNINGIIEFDNHVAIVLHSSIIFLSKYDDSVSVHMRNIGLSVLQRVKNIFNRP